MLSIFNQYFILLERFKASASLFLFYIFPKRRRALGMLERVSVHAHNLKSAHLLFQLIITPNNDVYWRYCAGVIVDMFYFNNLAVTIRPRLYVKKAQ